MALQKRVSQLPAVSQVVGTDLLIVSSANATKRTTVQQIGAYFQANGVAGPQGPAGPAGTTTWAGITGKPSTFPPSAHVHTIADVTGLQGVLDGKQAVGSYATLTDGKVPAAQLPSYVDDVIEAANLAALPATGETGKIYVTLDTNKTYRWSGSAYVEISASPGSTDAVPEGSTNLYFTNARASAAAPVQSVNGQTGAVSIASYSLPVATGSVLGGVKIGSGVTITDGVISVSTSYAASSHSHAISDVTGLQNALDGKQASGSYAAAVHTHGISDVTGLQTALDGKQASGSYAAANHGHAIADVTGLQTALDGKAALSHTHSAADVVSGTLAEARLSHIPLHPFLLMGG